MSEDKLNALKEAVIDGEDDLAGEIVEELLGSIDDPMRIINGLSSPAWIS